jgi:hypothetical protein
MNAVFYQDEEVRESDIPVIADAHDVDVEVVRSFVDILRKNGTIDLSETPEDQRPKLAELVSNLHAGHSFAVSETLTTRDVDVLPLVTPTWHKEIDEVIVHETLKRHIELLSDHFHMHPDTGEWGINPDSPPDLQTAYDAMAAMVGARRSADAVSTKSEWWIANMIGICEDYFGEEFDPQELAVMMNRDFLYVNRLIATWKWTQKYKRFNLPISTHVEVITRSGVLHKDKLKILERVERDRLGQVDARVLVEVAKAHPKNGRQYIEYDMEEVHKIHKEHKRIKFVCFSHGFVYVARIPESDGTVPVAKFVVRLPRGGAFVKAKNGEMLSVTPMPFNDKEDPKYAVPRPMKQTDEDIIPAAKFK